MQAHADDTTESRITRLETIMEHVQYMLERMERRFEDMETKINYKLDKMEQRINAVNQRLDASTRWLIGIGVTSLLSVFAAITNIAMKMH